MFWRSLLLIVLIIALAFSSYYLYISIQQFNAEPINFIPQEAEQNSGNLSSSLQFYPNMRFASKDISYNISSSCDSEKVARILGSFDILKADGLNFYPANVSEARISIKCQTTEVKPGKREKYYIAGEGGPTAIINTSLFSVIEKGEILLFYQSDNCDKPNIELHELLHVFGFDHSADASSIMYPTSFCNQQIPTSIVSELIRLYSIPELPDLTFVNISAMKTGSYLDFTLEIINQGLKNATKISIVLAGDNVKITNYSLKDIAYGEGRYLEVKNLKVSRNVKELSFLIVNGDELNTENNLMRLSLPGE